MIAVRYIFVLFIVSITLRTSFGVVDLSNRKNLAFSGPTSASSINSLYRNKRSPYHIIKDCVMVTSESGQFFHKAESDDSQVCGVYFVTDADRTVEIHIDYMDVPCNEGGLVAFIDGWELNGQFYPGIRDHPEPLEKRFQEFCGQRKMKQILRASQNAALIQYRIPGKGSGFSFSVRYPKTPTPCNVLVEGATDVYVLKNYGKAVNCSLTALYPANIRVLGMNVGVSLTRPSMAIETGTIHKCQKRGYSDFVEIGGSDGLDSSRMLIAANVCGIDSKPGNTDETVFCEVTTVRLVSSGEFVNSVTLAVRQAVEDDILEAGLVCGL